MAASTVIPADTFFASESGSDVPFMKRHILDKGDIELCDRPYGFRAESEDMLCFVGEGLFVLVNCFRPSMKGTSPPTSLFP